MGKQAGIFLVDKIEMVSINKLKPWKNNPRNNEMAIEPVANSIKTYGMLVPLLINKKNEVTAGNTRYEACKLLQLKKVPCVREEHLTKQQQVAYNIADNKLHEIATWDQDALKDILSSLQGEFDQTFDYSLVGFQQAEIDLMMNGWNSNATRIGDVEAEDSVAPGKIIIECKEEDVAALTVTITEKILSKYEGAKIK